MEGPIDIEQLTKASGLLKMLSNSNRLAILCHLADGELSVGAIAERVGLSQSALSQHLAKLRELNLVTTRREHQTIFYSLSSEEAAAVMGVLQQHYCKS